MSYIFQYRFVLWDINSYVLTYFLFYSRDLDRYNVFIQIKYCDEFLQNWHLIFTYHSQYLF